MTYSMFKCSLEVTLEAPFLVAGLDSPEFGIDIPHIRDSRGRIILPDTHVKGVLRHAYEYCCEHGLVSPNLDIYFGVQPTKVDEFDTPKSLMVFHDLIANELTALKDEGSSFETFPRISIDEVTGGAREGHLLNGELVAPIGRQVSFLGELHLLAEGPDAAKSVIDDLKLASEFIGSVGHFKSVGFGTVKSIQFGDVSTSHPPSSEQSYSHGLYTFSFGLSKPFLVEIGRADKNTLEGADVIPGAVLKGALARNLALEGHDTSEGPLADVLESITIGHAEWVCGSEGAEGLHDKLWDLNRVDFKDDEATGLLWEPGLVSEFEDELQLPTFEPDWKRPWSPSEIAFETRTRVGINPKTGAAEEGQLFTQRLVCPFNKMGEYLTWRAQVYVPPVSSKNPQVQCAVNTVLECMSRGIHGIGKTSSAAVSSSLHAKDFEEPSVKNEITIRLLSPLLIVRTMHLNSKEQYQEAVAKYWEKAFGGAAELAVEADLEGVVDYSYFCELEYRHSYVSTRFRPYQQDGLEPFVLAKAGSVFNLTVKDGNAVKKLLNEYLCLGLPAAFWEDTSQDKVGELHHFDESEWRICPFLPQNGFGAFSLLEDAQ